MSDTPPSNEIAQPGKDQYESLPEAMCALLEKYGGTSSRTISLTISLSDWPIVSDALVHMGRKGVTERFIKCLQREVK